MLERQAEGWTAHCDGSGCAEELEIHSPDYAFSEVTQALNNADWKIKRTGVSYDHLCPACQEEENDA